MIVCPVCEHAQAAGAECDVCGKRLDPALAAAGGPAALDPLPPELLEPTRLAAIDAPPDDLPGLEPTGYAAVEVAGDAPGAELEPTCVAPVDVDAPPPPDLERTEQAGLPDDGPTALPAEVTCRYCRTPAPPGARICGRCGMRLPAAAALAVAAPDAPAVRHCSCGMAVRGWSACPACGARIASA